MQNSTSNIPEQKRFSKRLESSPKRFESSSGSDVGGSTRESEWSEENTSSSPVSLIHKPKGDLFDSLAAELRAKLNGNGPPILLPPRDYDTVHRSKGNLAAVELRRCQNSLIVGSTTKPAKQMSSRGSSGIGSDLAPSPERQDEHSSSEEENWCVEADNPIVALKTSPVQASTNSRHQEDGYLRDLPSHGYPRSTNKTKDSYNASHRWSKEDEIRPVIMRPPDYDTRFRRVLLDRQYTDDSAEFGDVSKNQKEEQKHSGYTEETQFKKYEKVEKALQRVSLHQRRYDRYNGDYDSEEEALRQHENLTDRQKYREVFNMREKIKPPSQGYDFRNRDSEDTAGSPVNNNQVRYNPPINRERNHSNDRYKTAPGKDYKYNENNLYKKHDNLPYTESAEKMIKSPVMRYKSLEDKQSREDFDNNIIRTNFCSTGEKGIPNVQLHEHSRHVINRRQINNSSPESMNISPKERFHDAKEKFRAMEKLAVSPEQRPPNPSVNSSHYRRSVEPLDQDIQYDNWSDEEPISSRNHREIKELRKNNKRVEDPYPVLGVPNSKSLSNLAKGYRHSYAESRPALPRASGRVGLAAVNPY